MKRNTILVVSVGAAALAAVMLYSRKKALAAAAAAAPTPTPQQLPPSAPSAGSFSARASTNLPQASPTTQTQTSPIVSGKPGVTVAPGPFDPVSSDWKRENAPSWWPW